MAGISLQAAKINNDMLSVTASEISIINDHPTAAITITTGLPATPNSGGITYGSFDLPAGQPFSWGNIPSGLQTITIDATGSSAQVAWS